jgi:hypothetical protein
MVFKISVTSLFHYFFSSLTLIFTLSWASGLLLVSNLALGSRCTLQGQAFNVSLCCNK